MSKDPPQITLDAIRNYKNNPNLKGVGVSFIFTKKQIEERVRCTNDPEYFIETYLKIVHVDRGLVPFKLYDFQKTLLHAYIDNRFVIAKLPRQTGKCVDKDTIVVLRYKKKYIIEVSIGEFYESIKNEDISKLLAVSKTICDDHEKQMLQSTMSEGISKTKTTEAYASKENGAE